MTKKQIPTLFKKMQIKVAKHCPEILIGVGIAGMMTTTILAVKATPKALDLIARAEDEKFDNGHGDELKVSEKIKAAWKCYIPAAVTCTISVGCLIGASSVSARRGAALAAAYKFSESALTEYRDKVTETIGEKKEREIRNKIVDDKLKENPASNNTVIVTGKGLSLCYDPMNDRYFESSYDAIKKVENVINKELICSDYVSLNDLYDELGLNHVTKGDKLGWNVNDFGKDMLEIYIGSHVSDDGRPCLSIDFNVPPRYKFDMYI